MLYVTLLLATAVAANPIAHASSQEAPLLSSFHAEVIPDEYIVVLKDHINVTAAQDHHAWVKSLHLGSILKRNQIPLSSKSSIGTEIVGGLRHIYGDVLGFSGYSGRFTDEVLEQLRHSPDVEFIERDSVVYALDQPRVASTDALEKNAPWGLARISHRDQLGFSTFNKYQYDSRAGEGVTAYIIDTGINIDHVDFEGRAFWGKTIPAGDEDIDGNGHGTHCAGTVAGKRHGVAKNAKVVAVKVLRSNGSGTMSDVLKGVEWAAADHLRAQADAKKKNKPFKGSTANMSLGGGKATSLDRAVDAAVKAGIHFAVAAGNDNADACNYSPAAAVNAITVGASTLGDERAYFSNHGKCTDIFAPGLNILSTWIGSKYATNTISGTSMASPHICGLLTYALSLQPSSESGFSTPLEPAKLKKKMISLGSTGMLSDLPAQTPNILAYNGFESKGDPWLFEGDIAASTAVHDSGLKKEISSKDADFAHEFAAAVIQEVHEEIQGFEELLKSGLERSLGRSQ
ncbi:Autophagic serine protease Alp2 [Taphrina deformans PYCC 5710]|uniref:Autophagic serine protease Alp2 n=1 Tax=Taphrina deformans (strain PYCC 5710 / ATCC 11124 / CBS 356.35 / IMI 108563 / JCM 9778 / NBRC 8474) TaxID=1097556 RepID=R4X8S4_TAPDE|nr:Autophagic serine protease Alp2 [Taphrina deformans PYCC 5710]|eukprot:CCG81805.1 Autophagic serine protease Alp2 [Taphrina deformans PYCC 5710]